MPQNVAVIAGQVTCMTIERLTQNGSAVREWTLIIASRGESYKLCTYIQPHLDGEKIFSNWGGETQSLNLKQFSVDVDQYGSSALYLNSTTLEDAGLNTCVVESEPDLHVGLTSSSAQIIVFGKRCHSKC